MRCYRRVVAGGILLGDSPRKTNRVPAKVFADVLDSDRIELLHNFRRKYDCELPLFKFLCWLRKEAQIIGAVADGPRSVFPRTHLDLRWLRHRLDLEFH